MSKFFRNALATFDSCGKAFSDLDKTVANFVNESKAFNELTTRGKDFFNDLGDFVKEVHETMSDLEVEVPYDKATDSIKFTTEGGELTVEVTSNDGTRRNMVSTTIPKNAEVDKLTKSYDDEKKVITFIIPKKKDIKAIKNEKVQKLIKSYEEKRNALRDQLKSDIEKINAEIENTKESVAVEPNTNKGKSKPKRDSKGRFTAKVKNGKVKMDKK